MIPWQRLVLQHGFNLKINIQGNRRTTFLSAHRALKAGLDEKWAAWVMTWRKGPISSEMGKLRLGEGKGTGLKSPSLSAVAPACGSMVHSFI